MTNETITLTKDTKPRCLKCGSTQVYRRLNTNQQVCRTCGWVENHIKREVKQ